MDISRLLTSNRFLTRDPVHDYIVLDREKFDFPVDVKYTEFRMYYPEYLEKDLKEFLSNS